MPGTERLDKIGDDHYEMKMKMVIAAISGSFDGKVRIADQNPPESFRLLVEGNGKIGFVEGRGVAQADSSERSSTEVSFEGDVNIGGNIAAVGQRLLDTTSKMIIKRFFTKFNASVEQSVLESQVLHPHVCEASRPCRGLALMPRSECCARRRRGSGRRPDLDVLSDLTFAVTTGIPRTVRVSPRLGPPAVPTPSIARSAAVAQYLPHLISHPGSPPLSLDKGTLLAMRGADGWFNRLSQTAYELPGSFCDRPAKKVRGPWRAALKTRGGEGKDFRHRTTVYPGGARLRPFHLFLCKETYESNCSVPRRYKRSTQCGILRHISFC